MNKKIQSYIKLQIPAGLANPSPPIGPALGQKGINIMEFCKLFNKSTENLEKGTPIPVIITVYHDRTFTFIQKTPTVSFLLKKYANIKKGSSTPKKNIIGTITKKNIKKIAKIKEIDMTGANLDKIQLSIQGTAQSIGIKIEE